MGRGTRNTHLGALTLLVIIFTLPTAHPVKVELIERPIQRRDLSPVLVCGPAEAPT